MDMGHLYHDAVYGDPILALDVKEQLRTRELNACEEINLARKSQIYERAKDLCEKTVNHEKWRVGQTINMILERSPHLERSLAVEKARLEMLHSILVRRQAAKKVKEEGSTYTPATTTVSPVSRSTMSSKRPDTRKGRSALKGIGRRRRQDREKTQRRRRKEDGPILNTDFSLERHLPKTSLYSKRNEHAVKTLAKISWKMETRKRDHRRFQENLVHFSKPMMDRARMVLRGRPDIDVEQFLKEFEDFLNPREKTDCKIVHRKAKRKRHLDNETSLLSGEPSQGTLVQQSGEEENDDYLTLNTAESTFVGISQELLLHDLSNLSNENQLPQAGCDSLVQELPSRLQKLTINQGKEGQTELRGDGSQPEDDASYATQIRRGSEREGSFHLTAIVATKSDVMNLRSRPGSSATADQTLHQSASVKLSPENSRKDLEQVDVNNNEYHSSNNGRSSNLPTSNVTDLSSEENRIRKHIGDSNRLAFVTKIYHNDLDLPIDTQRSDGSEGVFKGKNNDTMRNEASYPHNGNRKEPSTQGKDSVNNKGNSTKPTSKTTETSSATPSTILSQIIFEEEEGIERKNRSTASITSTSPSHSYHQQSSHGRDNSRHQGWDSVDNGNLHKLPSLYNYGKAANTNTNSSQGFSSSGREQARTQRNQSPWRTKPEFADLFSTTKKQPFSKHLNASPSESEKSKPRQMKPAPPNLSRKNDLFEPNVYYGKKNQNQSSFQDGRRNNPYRFPLQNPNSFKDNPLFPTDKPKLLQNLPSKSMRSNGLTTNSYHGGKSPEEAKESGTVDEENYTFTCTTGLPKLWKQSMDKKKDPRAEQEVSAAAVARRHRRGRMNSQSMF